MTAARRRGDRCRVVGVALVIASVVAGCTSGADETVRPVGSGVGSPVDTAAPVIETSVASSEPGTDSIGSAGAPGGQASESTSADGSKSADDVVTQVDGPSVRPEGFDSTSAVVTAADGSTCEICLWLATTDSERAMGLMGVTDLGDAVGMAFVWPQPVSGSFYMFRTPTPLSIAWFDADGDHVGEADMDPCLVDDSSECERYGADGPYTVAVEMFSGQLAAIGIGPGAGLELLDVPCVAP